MIQPTLLILAAGIGSRYGGVKQLEKIGPCGETILDYSVFDAKQAGFGKVVFVIRKSIEKEFNEFVLEPLSSYISVDYVLQEIDHLPNGFAPHPERKKPWGTGHAVLMAQGKIREPFAVINADDFYGADAYRALAGFLSSAAGNQYSMVGYMLENTLSEHGTVSRGVCYSNSQGLLARITERTKISRNHGRIVFDDNSELAELDPKTVVSMNCWGFTPGFFDHLASAFSIFLRTNSDPISGEFYLPWVVSQLIGEGTVTVKILSSNAEWFGITYRDDRPHVVERLKQLHLAGVYSEPLWR